jgi:hypothetical protein
MTFVPEPGLIQALQTPQPAVIAGLNDPAVAAQSVNGWIRTANAFSHYHKQVPLQAFNSIYLLNMIGNNWGGWKS